MLTVAQLNLINIGFILKWREMQWNLQLRVKAEWIESEYSRIKPKI